LAKPGPANWPNAQYAPPIGLYDLLEERLAGGQVIVLDGGTGSELQARGAPMDYAAWSAIANLTHPDLVREIHADYIAAGAEVVIANTFAAGVGPLAQAGLQDRLSEINRAGVRLAREAADGRPVAVAGSLSVMTGDLEFGQLANAYRAQAEHLADAGADLLALEMMLSPTHALPALTAAAATGLPVWLGISAAGDATHDGVPVAALLDQALATTRPDAVLVMHTNLDDTETALDIVTAHYDGPVGAYPHEGVWERPDWVFTDITPEDFAARVAPWRERGARLLGGCCGTSPAHIAALAAALR
jgi:S-methylmethionine-dependent homocysteine/selenocysteine methylase